MKRILLSCCFFLLYMFVFAQSDDVEKLHENAKVFMRQGDYANASLILTRALAQAPGNIEIAKDLAYDYYLQKENADDQAYQIGGTIYRAMGQKKDAEKLYKKAIKSYPKSGSLYNEYGEM